METIDNRFGLGYDDGMAVQIVKKYAWLPTKVYGRWIWLETYLIGYNGKVEIYRVRYKEYK